MVKRYDGNTGRVIRVPETGAPPGPAPRPQPAERPPARPPARPTNPLPGPLQQLFSRSLGELETEDLLLLLILYLLYRESGDQDWLVTLGAMLFL